MDFNMNSINTVKLYYLSSTSSTALKKVPYHLSIKYIYDKTPAAILLLSLKG
ncbi:hypothetical protein [Clostridioides difficile]|uniref:hypothetical protein n=1 Tax=Clostridioides difficile TaxID=1496 RepID=UPI001F3ADFCE|nr:hypothetical protein [Clostridioides difficile]MDW0092353.1 hypothetical protein [Clostridioides difficile]